MKTIYFVQFITDFVIFEVISLEFIKKVVPFLVIIKKFTNFLFFIFLLQLLSTCYMYFPKKVPIATILKLTHAFFFSNY